MFKENIRNDAYIGLGSNKGNKIGYLSKAVEKLEQNNICEIDKISSIYETKPFGNVEQDNFLNAVVKIKTSLGFSELFKYIKNIELELGRTKTVKWGPREIDLDLLLFNDLIFKDKNLKIPHEGIIKRDFVLVPLCEIEPDLIHPEKNEKICDICNRISEKNIIKKIPNKLNHLIRVKSEQ